MKPISGQTISTWMATADAPSFGMLDSDTAADVCVIGAGIAGATTAFLLAKRGFSVVVLDDGPVAGGETQRTTAHLSNVIDDRFSSLLKTRGEEIARLAYQAHSQAIDLIESIVVSQNLDCDLRRVEGYLFLGEGQERNIIDDEFEACKKIGFAGVDLVESFALTRTGQSVPAIRFPMQAQFHPLKYISGLARLCSSAGVRFYSGVHATEVTDTNGGVTVQTLKGQKVQAKFAVVATNSPVTNLVKIHTKQAPYRTYAIAGKVPAGKVVPALYWDTQDPYHYVRTQPCADPAFDYLIVGGEDHRTGEADDASTRFANLESWARSNCPSLGEIEQRWSGQVLETIDGLAFIGRDPSHGKNVFVATGDSGMGMTHGTIAGIIISDLVGGNDNRYVEVFDPARKPVGTVVDYVAENANTAAQYFAYLQPGDVPSVANIVPGQGAVVAEHGNRVAAYRDEQGHLWQYSAVCPHLKGIVCWNSCEKSWDCPAHGSRFDAHGNVLNGPANCSLSPLAPEKRLQDEAANPVDATAVDYLAHPRGAEESDGTQPSG